MGNSFEIYKYPQSDGFRFLTTNHLFTESLDILLLVVWHFGKVSPDFRMYLVGWYIGKASSNF
jgi:hypothetical protein